MQKAVRESKAERNMSAREIRDFYLFKLGEAQSVKVNRNANTKFTLEFIEIYVLYLTAVHALLHYSQKDCNRNTTSLSAHYTCLFPSSIW